VQSYGGDHEGGIIKQEHGGGLMEEETWRGKYGGRNMGEETLRMNHEAVITGGESLGGGIMEENHKAATVGNLGSIGNVSGKHPHDLLHTIFAPRIPSLEQPPSPTRQISWSRS